MKWFKGIENVEQLRKKYKELLRIYHPDNGGNVSDMQEINSEYDRLFAILSKEEQIEEQSSTYDKDEENTAFKAILNQIITLNIDAEIIGSWIWIQGGYSYRELLKSINFKYAPKKKAWCWHYGEYHRHHNKEVSLDDIRAKYGSQKVKNKSRERQFVLN